MNKKKKIIILFFLLVSFFYGYFLHKYQIFPYQIAKNFQNYLLEYKEKNSEFYILNKKNILNITYLIRRSNQNIKNGTLKIKIYLSKRLNFLKELIFFQTDLILIT